MHTDSGHSEVARLEAFSDGVFAIIITIMVLELRPPQEASLEGLIPLVPVFLSYALSFTLLAIYWNNHHHLLREARGVSAAIMWANMHLLFWLSLVPFGTTWIGMHHQQRLPAFFYGIMMLGAAKAYSILSKALVKQQGGKGSHLAEVLGANLKGKSSLIAYALSIPLALVSPWISYLIFVLVALLWFVPDRRLDHRH